MFIILHYAAILNFNIEKEHRFFPTFRIKEIIQEETQNIPLFKIKPSQIPW